MHSMRLCLQEETGLERTGQDRGGEKEKKEIETKEGRRGEREKEQWGREGGKQRLRPTTIKESLCYTNYRGLIFLCALVNCTLRSLICAPKVLLYKELVHFKTQTKFDSLVRDSLSENSSNSTLHDSVRHFYFNDE